MKLNRRQMLSRIYKKLRYAKVDTLVTILEELEVEV